MASKIIPLEDVFKTSGIPIYTFVKPLEYDRLKVFLRTKGRGLIVEGPSGIGKTTSILKALEDLSLASDILNLSARKPKDLEYIQDLPNYQEFGTIIIDDFHALEPQIKKNIADFMKVVADESNQHNKLILVGINKAGNSLVQFAGDLNNRIDTVKFEKNPDIKIEELISLGEKTLNISMNTKKEIIELSKGSFHIAQMLSKETCIVGGVTEGIEVFKNLEVSLELVKEQILEDLHRAFYDSAKAFATGPRLRPEGRSPYLHLLSWLSKSEEWSVQINDLVAINPKMKGSVTQIVEKGYLEDLIESNENIQKVIHFDKVSKQLTIEDPKFFFYLKNILWSKFAKKIGYLNIDFDSKYDFALSFAGADRELAEKISNALVEREVQVFYDKNEQHRILASDVEDYLAPIYRSEAKYIIVLMSNQYPSRLWTKFESDQFKHRFGESCVIPIWFSDIQFSLFDISRKVGGFTYDINVDMNTQVEYFTNQLCKKITSDRETYTSPSDGQFKLNLQ
jgi:hypothetical protein